MSPNHLDSARPEPAAGPTHDFGLIEFKAGENRSFICGLAWLDGGQLRIASPALRGSLDRPDAQAFADELANLEVQSDEFVVSMTWLGLVTPAAQSLGMLQRTCERFADQRLRCIDSRIDDPLLLELYSAYVNSGRSGDMPGFLLQAGLLMTLNSIVGELSASEAVPAFRGIKLGGDDIALIEFGQRRRTIVTLRQREADLLAIGLTAHERIGRDTSDSCLLVLPDLELVAPLTLSSRVIACNLSRGVIAAAIERLATLAPVF